MPGDERDEIGAPNDGRGQAKPVIFLKPKPDPTANCEHWGHEPGEWKWSCCACSGLPNGCDNCTEYGPEFDEVEP